QAFDQLWPAHGRHDHVANHEIDAVSVASPDGERFRGLTGYVHDVAPRAEHAPRDVGNHRLVVDDEEFEDPRRRAGRATLTHARGSIVRGPGEGKRDRESSPAPCSPRVQSGY